MRVCACPPNNNGSVWSYLYSDGVHSSYGHTANFNYDALNRLSSASATGQSTYTLSFDYTHDSPSNTGAYGNAHCTSTGGGGNPNLSFSSSTNRITGYNYDAAGHVTSDGTYTYGWDGDGRLSSVSTSSGVLYNVVYYPDGHVAQEAQPHWDTAQYPNAASHDYSYDLFGNIAIHLFGTYGGGFNGIETISLGDRWLAQYNENNPAGTYFAHPNELGTNVAWTNWAGAQTTDQTFYPWGGDWQTSGSPEQHFARMGTREPFLGLDLTANRMYNSNLGRWLTPDPAGKGAVHLDDPQTWNMYAYTRNNFTTLTDPTGLLEADPGSTAQQHQEQSAGTQNQAQSGAGTPSATNSTTDLSQGEPFSLNLGGTEVNGHFSGVELSDGRKGDEIDAQPEGCSDCRWAQTTSRTGEGSHGEHTDNGAQPGSTPLYPADPIVGSNAYYDRPASAKPGTFKAVTTLGVADEKNKVFKIMGSMTSGYKIGAKGNLSVTKPRVSTTPEQQRSLDALRRENPGWTIR